MRTLIRDALVVPGDGQEPFVGWLLVAEERIAALGPGEPPATAVAAATVDGRERALVPGLVNAHGHSHSSLTRGSAEGRRLEDWLQCIEAEQARLTEEQALIAARATYCEALLGGTTCFMDMCLHPAAAVQAAREVGLRLTVAPYVADRKPFTPALAVTERLLAQVRGEGDRIRLWVGLHDLESCSDEQILAGVDLAARHGTGVHLHCAETSVSVERTRARTGQHPVAYLRHLGALGPRTLLAHCVWTEAAEHRLLAESGAAVAHCPHANLKLASGVAPVPAMRAAGVPVALATDGAKANNGLDMFDVMKFASLLPKGVQRDPQVLPAQEVLAMATQGGAQALGLPACGTLAPGQAADLVLVRLDRFHLQPATPQTITTNLVHAARGSDVDWVMVAGRVLVAGGAVQSVDAAAVRAAAAAVGRALL